MRRSRRSELFAGLICLAVTLLLVTTESLAGGKRGRGRPQITRSGPASHGSYGDTARSRRNDAPRRNRAQANARATAPQAREVGDSYDRRRQALDRQGNDRDRSPVRVDYWDEDRDRDSVRERDDYRDRDPDVVRRHRIWHRGHRITYVEYSNYGCGEVVVVVDGDKYYECEGTWFVRTYYGGELVYTATDPPSGY